MSKVFNKAVNKNMVPGTNMKNARQLSLTLCVLVTRQINIK